MTTKKKQKLVGLQEYIDPRTGEVVPMQIVSVEDRDFNFHKVWLEHLINSLDSISNQKLRLAFWIIDHLNKENQLVMTQRQIASESGMSLKTVSRTIQALQEGDPPFLLRLNISAYAVNPDIIWKGSHKSRMGVVFDYQRSIYQKESVLSADEELRLASPPDQRDQSPQEAPKSDEQPQATQNTTPAQFVAQGAVQEPVSEPLPGQEAFWG